MDVDGENAAVKKPYELRMIPRHYGEPNAAPARVQTDFIPKHYTEMPVLPKKARALPTDKLYRK